MQIRKHLKAGTKFDIINVCLLVLFFTALFLVFLKQPGGSDDCSYFEMAARMFEHNGSIYTHADRNGLILSIKLSQAIFGYTNIAYHAVAFAYSLGLILSVYFLGSFLFNRIAGFLAAISLLGSSLFVNYMTALVPDIPATCWFVAGLYFFARAFGDNKNRLRTYLFAAISAILFFLGYWTKETMGVMALALPLYLIVVKDNKHRYRIFFFIIATGLVLVCLGFLWNYIVYDDALFRLHKFTERIIPGHNELWIKRGLIRDDYTWMDLLIRYPKALLRNYRGLSDFIFGLTSYQIVFYSFAVFLILIIGKIVIGAGKRASSPDSHIAQRMNRNIVFISIQALLPFLLFSAEKVSLSKSCIF